MKASRFGNSDNIPLYLWLGGWTRLIQVIHLIDLSKSTCWVSRRLDVIQRYLFLNPNLAVPQYGGVLHMLVPDADDVEPSDMGCCYGFSPASFNVLGWFLFFWTAGLFFGDTEGITSQISHILPQSFWRVWDFEIYHLQLSKPTWQCQINHF